MSEQTGGKLLAQGVDGCIFIPRLKCKGNSFDFVKSGELMVDKLTNRNSAEYEFKIAQKILNIPLFSNYFIIPSDICTPEAVEKQTEPDLTKCEIPESFNNTKILRMPYGGVSLYNYSFNLKTFSPIQFTKHLLEAGALLALNGIVHNDLHQGNIIVDDNSVPRIIDFGRAIFTYETISERYFIHPYSARYFQEPPDYFLLNSKINDYSKKLAMADFLDKRSVMIEQLFLFFNLTENDIISSMEEYIHLSSSYKNNDYVGWFNHHWRTNDSWAIGVRLLDCFFNLLYFKTFENKWKEDSSIIMPVLKRLVEINPFRRIDCVQALDMLEYLEGSEGENIIIQNYGSGWLDKIGRIR